MGDNMKRRIRWSHGLLALAVIAALAIASPAIGGPSLKKLVKKEVAKQISKATGPAGPAGANGANGANGTDGTARAYAFVHSHAGNPCAPICTFDRSKGITGVTHPGAGQYCIDAPGIDPASVPPAVTTEWQLTTGPEGNAIAMALAAATDCPAGQFEVRTERLPSTNVRNAADNGSIAVAGNAVDANDVSFTVVIP